MTFNDITGKEIKIDDIVVVPRSVNGSPYLQIGKVTKLNPQTIVVNTIKNVKEITSLTGKTYRLTCNPYIGEEHKVRNPHRCLVINLGVLPENYQEVG